MIRQKAEIIENITEKFVAVDVKTIDAKNRINLGGKVLKMFKGPMKADAYKVFVSAEGDVLLRPVTTIPSREAWIFKNPEVIEQIRQGLAEAATGKVTKVDNLDEFFEKL